MQLYMTGQMTERTEMLDCSYNPNVEDKHFVLSPKVIGLQFWANAPWAWIFTEAIYEQQVWLWAFSAYNESLFMEIKIRQLCVKLILCLSWLKSASFNNLTTCRSSHAAFYDSTRYIAVSHDFVSVKHITLWHPDSKSQRFKTQGQQTVVCRLLLALVLDMEEDKKALL